MKYNSIYTLMVLVLSTSALSKQAYPGHYTAKMISVIPSENGKEWAADVTLKNGYNNAMVYIVGGIDFQLWEWNAKTLDQDVFASFKDEALPASKYNQVLIHKGYRATNDGGKYRINCKNRKKGDCEGDMSPSCYWVITTTEEGFTYEWWGITKGISDDLIKVNTLNFKLVK